VNQHQGWRLGACERSGRRTNTLPQTRWSSQEPRHLQLVDVGGTWRIQKGDMLLRHRDRSGSRRNEEPRRGEPVSQANDQSIPREDLEPCRRWCCRRPASAMSPAERTSALLKLAGVDTDRSWRPSPSAAESGLQPSQLTATFLGASRPRCSSVRLLPPGWNDSGLRIAEAAVHRHGSAGRSTWKQSASELASVGTDLSKVRIPVRSAGVDGGTQRSV